MTEKGKYDAVEEEEAKDAIDDIKKHLEELNEIKQLDEQNPLEQAIKYKAVKQNPPEPDYMKVECFEEKDADGKPIVISKSEKKEYTHSPFFVIDLNKALLADITACPSSVGPMLIDMSQKLVELKKKAFKSEVRKSEFNWWWIVLMILLIPGIITVILMFLGGI
jgi:hypothetical protein